MDFLKEHAHFFTATILDWKPLLSPEKYKRIITDSLAFLFKEKHVFIFAFVIMDNHIHLIWQMRNGFERKDVQRDFLKFTSQMIKFDLIENNNEMLIQFEVNKRDRKYQFWQRDALSVDLYTQNVFEQKVDYIHNNPVKKGLCQLPEDYRYSSASFYEFGESEFEFLSHYDG